MSGITTIVFAGKRYPAAACPACRTKIYPVEALADHAVWHKERAELWEASDLQVAREAAQLHNARARQRSYGWGSAY
mgnify:CR=1 FL=1